MCGVFGYIKLSESDCNVKAIAEQCSTIQKHRGPDDEGYVYFNKNSSQVYFGKDTLQENFSQSLKYAPKNESFNIDNPTLVLSHRRLSIIDLSPLAHQPMCDDSENFWITFNGEIYNFKEIREKLKKMNFKFISNSDTEVVLKSYIAWGAKCVEHFNGMWAFAIYDKKQNKLFCSRDRFGVKPFYYVLDKEKFAFASEIKTLVPLVEKKINESAVYDYLILGNSEAQEKSLFSEIYELFPGYNLDFDVQTKSVKKAKYFKLNYSDFWEKVDPLKNKEIVSDIRELTKKAIQHRLLSDVKVGTCLSGGLDSSIIACVVNSLINEKQINQVGELQNVFTAIYPNEKIDEKKWAEYVVKNIKSDWHTTTATAAGLLCDFEDLVYTQDIPFISSSTYSQFRVFNKVSESDVKVTLDGQGADELFAGYKQYYSSFLREAFKNNDFETIRSNSKSGFDFSNTKSAIDIYLKQLSKNKFPNISEGKYWKLPEITHINKMLSKCKIHSFKDFQSNYNSLNNHLFNDFTASGLKTLLRTGDRNSMRFSIESRMPFAEDIELIKYMFLVSSSYKIQKGEGKYLLKQAFKNGLPQEILNRKDKIGFATPEQKWLYELKNEILDYFPEKEDEFVDWKSVRKNWNKLIDISMNTTSVRLWRLINFAVWRKVFKV